MSLETSEVSEAILEMRDLLRLLAEPAIAERDKRRRDDLKQIVGASESKGSAVYLMNGTRTQIEIHKETALNKGSLSILVKQLNEADLLTGDVRKPKLAISIPGSFFDK